jgi:hypothetical protein
MGSRGKCTNTATLDVVAPSGLTSVIQLMVKPVMLMWVPFLMTTLMWMKILINGDKDKEVGKLIDALIIEHRFAKNYGPRHIISEL